MVIYNIDSYSMNEKRKEKTGDLRVMRKKRIITMILTLGMIASSGLTALAASTIHHNSANLYATNSKVYVHGYVNVAENPIIRPYSYSAILSGKDRYIYSAVVSVGTGSGNYTNKVNRRSLDIKIGYSTRSTEWTWDKAINMKLEITNKVKKITAKY